MQLFNPNKTGLGEDIDIFWTLNDPPGLRGLRETLKKIKKDGNKLNRVKLDLKDGS